MNEFTAADMSTAAANGFRDGLAAQPAAAQEADAYQRRDSLRPHCEGWADWRETDKAEFDRLNKLRAEQPAFFAHVQTRALYAAPQSVGQEPVAEVIQNPAGQAAIVFADGKTMLDHVGAKLYAAPVAAAPEVVALRTAMQMLEQIAASPDDKGAKFLAAATVAFLTTQGSSLRSAPEVTEDAIERAAKALHANGADSLTSDTPWSELHAGEASQFRSWAGAAMTAARPQGVK